MTLEPILIREITNEVSDPYETFGNNLGSSRSIFFHGTTTEALQSIEKTGFEVLPHRPTLSLNPYYSLSYCRKSESYLRGLIKKGLQKELDLEIDNLVENKVIAREEPASDKFEWWIKKADDFYGKNTNLTESGVLLGFLLTKEEVITPDVAKMYLANYQNSEIIFGPPSFWRTRQFAINGDPKIAVNLKSRPQIKIFLTEGLLKFTEGLTEGVKEGKLTKEFLTSLQKQVGDDLKFEIYNLSESQESLKATLIASLTDQIIESAVIKTLRDVYIARLRASGHKVFVSQGEEFVEDPRWGLTSGEISKLLNNLEANQYPSRVFQDYVERFKLC